MFTSKQRQKAAKTRRSGTVFNKFLKHLSSLRAQGGLNKSGKAVRGWLPEKKTLEKILFEERMRPLWDRRLRGSVHAKFLLRDRRLDDMLLGRYGLEFRAWAGEAFCQRWGLTRSILIEEFGIPESYIPETID